MSRFKVKTIGPNGESVKFSDEVREEHELSKLWPSPWIDRLKALPVGSEVSFYEVKAQGTELYHSRLWKSSDGEALFFLRGNPNSQSAYRFDGGASLQPQG